MEAWNTGHPRTRRDLLATFFDELTVRDGQIFDMVPRKDREALVGRTVEAGIRVSGMLPKRDANRTTWTDSKSSCGRTALRSGRERNCKPDSISANSATPSRIETTLNDTGQQSVAGY